MTDQTDSSLSPDKERFSRAIQYFAQNRFEHKASAIPDEILDTPVVLGIVSNPTSPQPVVATLKASVLVEYIELTNPIFVRGHNTPFPAGSRPEYPVIVVFDEELSAEHLKELLGITSFEIHTFRKVLEAGLLGDGGICLWNDTTLSIIEADRVNEYGRASLPRIEKTETGDVLDKLSDVSEKHNLRPEEVAELNALLAEQDWIIGQPLLGSAKYDGMKANLLLVTPKPGLSREEVIGLVQALGQAASQIKSPFLVMPVGGKAPIERGGLS